MEHPILDWTIQIILISNLEFQIRIFVFFNTLHIYLDFVVSKAKINGCFSKSGLRLNPLQTALLCFMPIKILHNLNFT